VGRLRARTRRAARRGQRSRVVRSRVMQGVKCRRRSEQSARPAGLS
jgi:hypothetical protein